MRCRRFAGSKSKRLDKRNGRTNVRRRRSVRRHSATDQHDDVEGWQSAHVLFGGVHFIRIHCTLVYLENHHERAVAALDVHIGVF